MLKRILTILAAVKLTILMVVTPACSQDPIPTDIINIGATQIELNALLYVADEQGYFIKNGIQLAFKEYPTGAAAIEGLNKGEVDIGLTFESVIVNNIFQNKDINVLATIDRSILFYLVARADRGISGVKDLKGKNIGVPRNTIMEFYLGRMLALDGLNIRDITMVDMAPADAESTIKSGNLDAIIVFEPYVTQIQRNLGGAVITWPAQSNQLSYWSMASSLQWIDDHPGLVSRFFQSLEKAEKYITLQEKKTKEILKDRLKYDDEYLDKLWKDNQFTLSLDQALITAMEDEARWMIENNLTTGKEVPDFTAYIYEHALKEIKPEAVTIFK
jgi:NitT/TauT family transport system substrate-binding protein